MVDVSQPRRSSFPLATGTPLGNFYLGTNSLSCPYLGLCLENESMVETKLVRRAGASDLD
jgi:hypothetical protein